ncbi:MAG: hypothetical protein IJ452_06365 [Butyricicoccus sp.]|nr:hypothetical protein [Butyricicoccus sp.]MBQ8585886.1 hypothetical protein [Butyricicoccus sp.]
MKKRVISLFLIFCLILSGTALAGQGVEVMNYSQLVAAIAEESAKASPSFVQFLPAEDFGWPADAVLTLPKNVGIYPREAWTIPAGATVLFERNCRGIACTELTIAGTMQTSYGSQDAVYSNCTDVIVAPTAEFFYLSGEKPYAPGISIPAGKTWTIQKGADLNARIALGGTLTGEGTVSGQVNIQGGFSSSPRSATISGDLTFTTSSITMGTASETYADTLTIPAGSHIKLNQGGKLLFASALDTVILGGKLEILGESGQYEYSSIGFQTAGKLTMSAGSELILHNPAKLNQSVVKSSVDLTEETKDQFPCLIDGTGAIKIYGEEAVYNFFSSSPDDVARFLADDTRLIPAELFVDFSQITLFRSWACEHQWGTWITTKQPTCTEPGTRTASCTVCETISNEEVAATGHTEQIIPAIEPTQMTVGYTEAVVCSVCEAHLSGGEKIPALFAEMTPIVNDDKLIVLFAPAQEFRLFAAFYGDAGQFCDAGLCDAAPGMTEAAFDIPANSSSYCLFSLDADFAPLCESFDSIIP